MTRIISKRRLLPGEFRPQSGETTSSQKSQFDLKKKEKKEVNLLTSCRASRNASTKTSSSGGSDLSRARNFHKQTARVMSSEVRAVDDIGQVTHLRDTGSEIPPPRRHSLLAVT